MLGHRHNHGPRLRAGCQLCEQGPAPAPAPAPSRPGAGPPGGASRAPPLPLGGCCAAPPGTGTVEPGRRPMGCGPGVGGLRVPGARCRAGRRGRGGGELGAEPHPAEGRELRAAGLAPRHAEEEQRSSGAH